MAKKNSKSKYLITFTIIIVVMATSLIFGGFKIIQNWDFLNIKEIHITGNQNLETLFLEEQVKGLIGKNIFKISQFEIANKFQNIVRVKRVEINRKIPKILEIEITERVGQFLIKTKSNNFRVIDKDLVILDNDNFYKNEILPIISTDIPNDSIIDGEKLKNVFVNKIISIHKKIKEIDAKTAKEVSEYYSNNGDVFMVNTISKNKLVLPDENFSEQFKKYLYLKNNNLIDTSVIVNLKFENQIFEVEEDD